MSGWLAGLASAAFIAGLAGGVHCAAMCGPILAACSSSARKSGFAVRCAIAYNAGRIASYTLAGVAAGALGQAALALRPGPPAQHVAMIAAGTSMLVLGACLAGLGFTRRLESAGALVWRHLQPCTRHFLPADTVPKALGLGAVWGWLPCGLVYGALLTATATGSALTGGVVMLSFGLGTLPNMIALGVVAAKFQLLARTRVGRLAVAGSVAAGGLVALALAGRHYFVVEPLCRLP